MQTLLYWLAFIAYSLIVIYIGYRLRPKEGQDPENMLSLEFWMAKRQLPGWRLAVSLTSGWLMLGWIGFGMSQIYMYGATGLWILPIPWFILCFIIIFMVPYVRRIGAVSLPQAIEKRFGKSARVLLALFSLFVFIAWTQAELFMAGTLTSSFLGIPAWLCMTLFILPILFYTYMGGFRAITATDVVQFGFMAVFMIILAATAIIGANAASGGDIVGALQKASPPWSGEGEVFNLSFLGWLFPIVLLIGYLPGWMIEQDLILRIQAVPTTREAYKGAIIGLVLISIFVIALPAITAFCALIVYPPVDGAPAAAIGESAYEIISAFITSMPLAISVFMLVGLVACQMSTIDTFANVSAMALGHDLIDPVLAKKRATAKQRLASAKWVSMGVLGVSLLCALISTSLNDVYYISSGVLSASIAIPAFFIFWKRTTVQAVWTASVLGFIGVVGGYFYEYKFLQMTDAEAPHYYINDLPQWLQGSYCYNYIAFGVVLSLIAIVVVSLITPKPSEAQLAEVKEKPIDDMNDFMSSVS